MVMNIMKTYLKLSLCLVLAASLFSCADQHTISVEKLEKAKQEAAYLNSGIRTAKANEWMKHIPDARHLSQLSVPGTHDSGALHEGWPGTAKCQALTISQQLEVGVRFLDIRCRHFNNDFSIHHGPVYQHQNFSDVLSACTKFLKSNPSEVIVMSVKPEHRAENNRETFYQRFQRYVTEEANGFFYLQNKIPLMREVRGKIVLLSRFYAPNNLGIQARHGWRDNTSFRIQNTNHTLIVQDNYKVGHLPNKRNAFLNLLTQSRQNNDIRNMYLNFASGYKPIFFIPQIPRVSNFMNPFLKSHLSSAAKNKPNGVVITDFMDADLAKLIYTSQHY